MAHYAFINEDNIVVDVISGRNENDLADGITSWEDYYGEVFGLRCLRTSYNTMGNVHWSQELDEELDGIIEELDEVIVTVLSLTPTS